MGETIAEGRVALVTGAGSGVGRASALALARHGYRVALVGRRAEALEETATLVGPAGTTLVLPADVTRPREVRAAFEAVRDRFGRLDVLFNNAGAAPAPAPIEEVALEDWHRIFEVNVTGLFLCTQEAFRLMKAQVPRGGRIINNGSVSAQVPRPMSAVYTASKHAVTGLTRATSLEGRAHDIACGQIDIGNAATELSSGFVAAVPQADGSRRREPFMDVENVAASVLLMADMPLDANVQFMTVMATTMPFIGRG
jgi:NAD(P)-dependent dehydrogenase (short-subunit alcohol dehydrogenase family)